MKCVSRLLLLFGLLSVVFFLLLVFLRIPFPLYPLLSWQDALDVLTPLVLMPIYWVLFERTRRAEAGLSDEIAFVFFAALWVAGQGMHLSANSIDNLIGHLAGASAMDPTGTQIYTLTHFFDEYLSHYLWHIGIIGLAGVLIYEAWQEAADEKTDWRWVLPAAFLYGITYFCIVLEGNTLPVGLPFAAIVCLVVLLWGREKLSDEPVLAFFSCSLAVATVLFAAWGIYWRGFPPLMQALGL